MRLAAIWRYPIKSMGGEQLEACELGADGIPGDRILQVRDARGRVVTSRSRPRLLTHRGAIGPDGEPLVDGRPWTSPLISADIQEAAGQGARLERGAERFDVLPLLVATDGAIEVMGVDLRRFRPNLVIGGVEGLAERDWEGRYLEIGGHVVVEMMQLRQRCIMTTFDPDTAEQDVNVLLRIRDEFDGSFALDTRVVKGGRIAVGDAVVVL